MENGIRAEFCGSNPHSNGDLFSRSLIIFFEIIVHVIIINIAIVAAIILLINTLIITFSCHSRFFDWKSNIFVYNKKVASSSVD